MIWSSGRNCSVCVRVCPSGKVTVNVGGKHTLFNAIVATVDPGDEVVDLMGMSHHERDPYLTAENWSSRTKTWPAGERFTREGWDPFFEFCASRGKHACFPEWSPIQGHAEYEPSTHPEEFFKLTRSYIEEHVELFAYDCYFNGDESKLTASPNWAGTGEYKKLWGRR